MGNQNEEKNERLILKAKKLLSSLSPGQEKEISDIDKLIEILSHREQDLESQNEALKSSREKLNQELRSNKSFFNLFPVAYITLDSESLVININNTALSLLNQSKPDITGASFNQFISGDYRQGFNSFIQSLKEESIQKTFECSLNLETFNWHRLQGIYVYDEQLEKNVIRLAIIEITKTREEQAGMDKLNKDLHSSYQAKINEFEILLNNELFSVIYLKEDRRFHRVNSHFERLFGYTQEELEGESVEVLHTSRQKFIEFGELYYRNFPLKKAIEWRLKKKDGNSIWCRMVGIPIHKSNYKKGIFWIIEDIQAIIESRKEISLTEKKFKTYVENSPTAIFLLNNDLNFIFANQSACKLLQHSERDLKTKSLSDIVAPTLKSKAEYFIELLSETGKLRNEIFLSKASGEQVKIILNAVRISEDEFIMFCINIHEWEKAERARQESQMQLTNLIGNVKGMVYRCLNNANWTMLFVSAGCYDLTGHKADDLINDQIIAYNDVIHNEDRQYVKNEIDTAFRDKRPFEIKYRIITADKNLKWVAENGNFIVNKRGDILYLDGIITDITAIMEAEKKLNKAKLKAEESDRLKSAFLANMSHEIRTPMNAVIGFSEILNSDKVEPQEIPQFLKLIRENSLQLMSIVNDIIDISRIETSQADYKPKEFNLVELLKTNLKNIKLSSGKSDLNFIFKNQLKQDEIIINTDLHKLRQIVINLLTNAVKFTDDGKVVLGLRQTQNYVEIYIQDTGIGIHRQFHDKIFDRFFNGPDEMRTKYGGTGLGLSICKGYADILGANIEFESEPGRGSEFRLLLPSSIVKIPKPGSMEYSNLKNKTILVVEDEDANYLLLEEILSEYNINIVRAENGKEAVKLVIEFNSIIDLILMDIKMPVMNGFEATRHIKELHKNIPIVAVTAYAMVQDKQNAMKAGCDDYISKPFARKDLLRMALKHIH